MSQAAHPAALIPSPRVRRTAIFVGLLGLAAVLVVLALTLGGSADSAP